VVLHLAEAGITPRISPFEPLEGEVRLAACRVHHCDLIGGIVSVLGDQLVQRRVRFDPAIRCVMMIGSAQRRYTSSGSRSASASASSLRPT
jgi:hypothetical protein